MHKLICLATEKSQQKQSKWLSTKVWRSWSARLQAKPHMCTTTAEGQKINPTFQADQGGPRNATDVMLEGIYKLFYKYQL